MDEVDLKVEALAWVRRACRGRDLPVVTSEFSLNGTGIRADLAILSRTFCGIEIKSAADTLKRLPSQMEGYARYFDQTMLIIAAKHERGLRAMDLHRAEVWVHEKSASFRQIGIGAFDAVPGHTLLGLLTAEEERRAERSFLQRQSAGQADDLDFYRTEFEAAFRKRYRDTSDQFWSSVKGRPIRRDDLNLLSRYYADRKRHVEAVAAEEAKWSLWAQRMAAA